MPFRRDDDFRFEETALVDLGGIGNKHWNVPRIVNPLFTGRAALIERIERALRSDSQQQKRLVITGLGGQGKSEICLKVANNLRQEYVAPSACDYSS